MKSTIQNSKQILNTIKYLLTMVLILMSSSLAYGQVLIDDEGDEYEESVGRKVYNIKKALEAQGKNITAQEIFAFLDKKYTTVEEFTGPAIVGASVKYDDSKGGEYFQFNILTEHKFLVNLKTDLRVINTKPTQSVSTLYSNGEGTDGYTLGLLMVGNSFNIPGNDSPKNGNFIIKTKYYSKPLPAVPGYRGATSEVRRVSIVSAVGSTFASAVIEVRAIPDDYVGTIHNDYIYYHADDDKFLSMYMAIDNKFGPSALVDWTDQTGGSDHANYSKASPDFVPVYRTMNGNGMFVEYKMRTGKRHKFSYTMPRSRDKQEIQYLTNPASTFYSVREGTFIYSPYSMYVGGRTGTGMESGAFNVLQNNPADYPFGRRISVNPGVLALTGVDSGMGFKDKGKTYTKGEHSIYSIQQSVSIYNNPELLFDGKANYDFDGIKGEDFDLLANKIQWLDTNNGADDSVESKGGDLYQVHADGTRTKIATYVKAKNVNTGSFVPESPTSLVIPGSQITRGINRFTYELVNTPIGLRNKYTISIYLSPTVNAKYVDQMGRDLSASVDPAWKGPFSGRVDDPFTLTYPAQIGTRPHFSTTPNDIGTPVASGANFTISTTFKENMGDVTFLYKGTQTANLTIKFIDVSNGKATVIKDFKRNTTDFAKSVTIEPDTGENIKDVVNYLIGANRMKINFPGYKALNAEDYVVEGGNYQTTIGTEDITIIYKYEGEMTWH